MASASVQPNGETTLPLNLKENNAGKLEIDANIFIDVCDKIRRIIVVERGQPAATQEPGCERRYRGSLLGHARSTRSSSTSAGRIRR